MIKMKFSSLAVLVLEPRIIFLTSPTAENDLSKLPDTLQKAIQNQTSVAKLKTFTVKNLCM